MRRVILQNEKFNPLKNVQVEMFDLTTGKTITSSKTNAAGIAEFPDQKAGTYWFRPLTTRGAGKSGEQTNYGAVKLSEMPIV